jgi:hypothetical protein
MRSLCEKTKNKIQFSPRENPFFSIIIASGWSNLITVFSV